MDNVKLAMKMICHGWRVQRGSVVWVGAAFKGSNGSKSSKGSIDKTRTGIVRTHGPTNKIIRNIEIIYVFP